MEDPLPIASSNTLLNMQRHKANWSASSSTSAASNNRVSTDQDVVIVGAGVAGLYAAYALNTMGYDVRVLEATDRHNKQKAIDTIGMGNGMKISLRAAMSTVVGALQTGDRAARVVHRVFESRY